jgi:hypothetical protein
MMRLSPVERARFHGDEINPGAQVYRMGRNSWYLVHGNRVVPRVAATSILRVR